MAAVSLPHHRLDLAARRLTDAQGHEVELRPQAMDLLCLLAAQPNTLLTKEQLMAAVWPGVVVTDDSLVQAIGDIRRALGDTQHKLVVTVPKRGYRLSLEKAPSAEPRARGALARRALTLPGLGIAALLLALVALLAMTRGLMPRQPPRPTDRAPIAVLPFKPLTEGTEAALLGAGLAEDLTTALARNSDLRVINAVSARMASQRAEDPVAAARSLGLRYVVDGSVGRVGERLRLTVRLNDATDGRVLWTEQQDASAPELPVARDFFVRRVAVALHGDLRSAESERVKQGPPASLDTYEKSLRAVALKHQFAPDALVEARRLLEEVTASDPGYAPGWAYLAMVNIVDVNTQVTGSWGPGRAGEIHAQIDRALQLDPGLPAAYFARAMLLSMAHRYDEALVAVEQCIHHAPSDADCLIYRASLLAMAGRFDAALQSLDANLPLVPLRPAYIDGFAAIVQAGGGRHADALASAERCLARVPHHVPCHVMRLLALVESGRLQQAREAAAEMQRRASIDRIRAFANVSVSGAELRGRIVHALDAAGVAVTAGASP